MDLPFELPVGEVTSRGVIVAVVRLRGELYYYVRLGLAPLERVSWREV